MWGLWILLFFALIVVICGLRVVNQYERKVLFTLWKYTGILKPGLKVIIPFIQTTQTVDIREKAVDVPSQEAMTKDNISCSINAVLYYNYLYRNIFLFCKRFG